MSLGERLRLARQAREMSLTDLALATDLSKGFISQVESGISNPSLKSLHKLTASLGLPPGALLEEASGGVGAASSRPYVAAQGFRVSETPGLKVFSLNSSGRNGIVPVASGGTEGMAVLLSLRPYVVLHGAAPLQPVAGMGSVAVLKGTIRLAQQGATVTARDGEVVTFDPGKMYTLICGQGQSASVYLSLPGGCQLPVRSDLSAPATKLSSYPRTGPFRLVEMRAMRGAIRASKSGSD
jgi:DNA-binding XRE family transcriptional regulator